MPTTFFAVDMTAATASARMGLIMLGQYVSDRRAYFDREGSQTAQTHKLASSYGSGLRSDGSGLTRSITCIELALSYHYTMRPMMACNCRPPQNRYIVRRKAAPRAYPSSCHDRKTAPYRGSPAAICMQVGGR